MDVPVEDHLDPAVAQGIGQGEDAVGMLVRVMTVAEEHPWRIRHRADPLRRSLVRPQPPAALSGVRDVMFNPGQPRGVATLPQRRGPSPIRAKTYGKEPLQPSIWANYIDKKGGVGGTPRDIAQNYGVQLAVGAMFAAEPPYCAQ